MGKTTEPKSSSLRKQQKGASISPKVSRAYNLINRQIKEKALKDPDVVRMIINENN
jgi:hypothetical protein